jgi:hypothetical protein
LNDGVDFYDFRVVVGRDVRRRGGAGVESTFGNVTPRVEIFSVALGFLPDIL